MNTHSLLGPGTVYQPSSAGDADLIAEATAHVLGGLDGPGVSGGTPAARRTRVLGRDSKSKRRRLRTCVAVLEPRTRRTVIWQIPQCILLSNIYSTIRRRHQIFTHTCHPGWQMASMALDFDHAPYGGAAEGWDRPRRVGRRIASLRLKGL